jgi:hypothetical protein
VKKTKSSDGQTQKITTRREKCVDVYQSSGLGEAQLYGQGDGIEQGRHVIEDCERGNTSRRNAFIYEGSDAIGKILKRLEVLEEAFNCYVGSHRQRLETRLDENKEFSNHFQKEMQQIKQEIYNLAQSEESKESS